MLASPRVVAPPRELRHARRVAVEVAAFESWDDAGRRLDLVACSNAWQWIDPVAAAAKAARLLRLGGTLARFWSFDIVKEPIAFRLRATTPMICSSRAARSRRSRRASNAGSARSTRRCGCSSLRRSAVTSASVRSDLARAREA